MAAEEETMVEVEVAVAVDGEVDAAMDVVKDMEVDVTDVAPHQKKPRHLC